MYFRPLSHFISNKKVACSCASDLHGGLIHVASRDAATQEMKENEASLQRILSWPLSWRRVANHSFTLHSRHRQPSAPCQTTIHTHNQASNDHLHMRERIKFCRRLTFWNLHWEDWSQHVMNAWCLVVDERQRDETPLLSQKISTFHFDAQLVRMERNIQWNIHMFHKHARRYIQIHFKCLVQGHGIHTFFTYTYLYLILTRKTSL